VTDLLELGRVLTLLGRVPSEEYTLQLLYHGVVDENLDLYDFDCGVVCADT